MTWDNSSPVDAPLQGPQDLHYTFSSALLALESPAKSRPAVVIHEMAAQLIAQQVDRGRRGVAVCASSRGAGSTLTSVNLAIAIAQAGVSVLLVDGDLHYPAVEALIAPSQPPVGLQQVLRSGGSTLEEAIHPEILPGLSVLYAGGGCPDASELIGGFACGEVMAACLRNYEYTIVDTPPANRSADARALASHVSYGLIVARRNRTYVDDLATLAGELVENRAEVIGTIFNAG
jgi:tyrosine-protein kinase Etk/Wzc